MRPGNVVSAVNAAVPAAFPLGTAARLPIVHPPGNTQPPAPARSVTCFLAVLSAQFGVGGLVLGLFLSHTTYFCVYSAEGWYYLSVASGGWATVAAEGNTGWVVLPEGEVHLG